MSEETFDLIATGIAFALALHAWSRRHAVISLATEPEGITEDAA